MSAYKESEHDNFLEMSDYEQNEREKRKMNTKMNIHTFIVYFFGTVIGSFAAPAPTIPTESFATSRSRAAPHRNRPPGGKDSQI